MDVTKVISYSKLFLKYAKPNETLFTKTNHCTLNLCVVLDIMFFALLFNFLKSFRKVLNTKDEKRG